VDISMSEGDTTGGYVNLLANLLFPLLAFAGLFFLFPVRPAPDIPLSLARVHPR